MATQAFANLAYGPEGLERLTAGRSAEAVVNGLTGPDEQREQRQLGVIDGQGRVANFTGSECFDWAGARAGDGYTCQGNILTGPEVIDRMCKSFERTKGELAARLLAALRAGDEAGGDKRGRQSAAILVVRDGGGYGGGTDVCASLRVDDHERPVDELDRLFEIHRLLFPRPEDLEFIRIDGTLAHEIAALLRAAGYPPPEEGGYGEGTRKALFEFVGTENLEERWSDEPKIESKVLEYLRARA